MLHFAASAFCDVTSGAIYLSRTPGLYGFNEMKNCDIFLTLAHNMSIQILWFRAEMRYEPRYEKTNVLVSDLVRHKPGVQLQKMARGLKFQN